MPIDQKTYIRDVYSKAWIASRHNMTEVGDYNRSLCSLIQHLVPRDSRLCEVAIGTGWPIADYLQRHGYRVSGVDIAPNLIDRCKQINQNIAAKVGDAENLEYPSASFDCVYCFHSTWYIPHLLDALEEMLRVCKPHGLVLFDILNMSNKKTARAYKKHVFRQTPSLLGKGLRYVSNTGRQLRGQEPDWDFVIFWTPTYPRKIFEFISRNHIKEARVYGVIDPEPIQLDRSADHNDFRRLLFVLVKT